ncbi:hypothetical protein FD754_025286 [Muntiacus muntjak]|uniref:MHC class I-like antigen recognition-like domain-containing protein n=1 Tax=Muntiacus muntjak TaxID=9888 RepID=A0A5N3UKV7_MUNMU|nr:hypothetical protein FD754_025286 [Muntiacus muntjak]
MSDLCQVGLLLLHEVGVLVCGLCFEGGSLFYADSLSCNITIDRWPRYGQSWCEVQGKVGEKVFLSYDCDRAEIKYLSPLGEEVKRVNIWETQTDTLRDTGDLLKEQMPDVTPERYTDKGPLALQARMTCWREDNGHINGSRKFGFHGKLCLLFDLENGHWTLVHSKGRRMKEKWGNARAVTDFFKKVSMETVGAESPTTGPPTVHSSAPAINHITWILPAVFTSFIITVFLG